MIGRNMKKGASALELAKTIKTVRLDGNSLTLDELVAVARYNAAVELTKTALDALRRSRALADKIAQEKRVAYGITTGFGDFATMPARSCAR